MGGNGRRAGASAMGQHAAAKSDLSSSGSSTGSQDKPGSEKIHRRTCLQNQLHKTKFCMYHLKGACQYGKECAFAHSYAELQATPNLRKTRLCTVFMEGKGCTNPSCPFAHGEDELRSTDMFYKKTLCIWNEKGKCRNGDQCRFAHGMNELSANQGILPMVLQEAEQLGLGGTAALTAASCSGVGKQVGQNRKVKAGAMRPKEVRQNANAAVAPADDGQAEPMKILPTRSLVECGTPNSVLQSDASFLQRASLQSQALPGGDKLQCEIERLRTVISALTVQCSSMKEMYGAPPSTNIKASLDPSLPGGGWLSADAFGQMWQGSADDAYIYGITSQ